MIHWWATLQHLSKTAPIYRCLSFYNIRANFLTATLFVLHNERGGSKHSAKQQTLLFDTAPAIHITIELLDICAHCVYPQAKLPAEILLAINFNEWLSHCITPVVDITNLFVSLDVFLRDVSICSPNDKIVYAIRASGGHDDSHYATVTPAKQRIFLHSKILQEKKNKNVNLNPPILMRLLMLIMHTRSFWFVRKCCLCQIFWFKGLTLLRCWTCYLGHHRW